MASKTAVSPAATTVLAQLSARKEELVEAYLREIVPGYRPEMDSRLGDVPEAAERLIGLLIDATAEGRSLRREEFRAFPAYIRDGLARGVTQAEILRAARMTHRLIRDALEEIAGPGGDALVARLSRPLIDYVDEASDMVVDAIDDLEAAKGSAARTQRQELLEDLLAGRAPTSAPKLACAKACGLGPETPLVVIAASPAGDTFDEDAMTGAAVKLSHFSGGEAEPPFLVRDGELVVLRPSPDQPRQLAATLERGQRLLANQGLPLVIGVSTVRTGFDQVRQAYDEAYLARERAAGPSAGGCLVLAALSALEYLLVRGDDDTAWNLIPPAVREFIGDDLAQAGLLIETLDAYVASSLNVKLAAEKLFVHPNTAYYRLAKIEDITGFDLRDLRDLQELMIAVRLARRRRSA